MIMYRVCFFILAGFIILSGCKKYEEAPLLGNPAYIRVFNSIPYAADALHTGGVVPFITFLMDPETDADGLPVNAKVVGDFMATRQLFSLSYPINAANSSFNSLIQDGRGSESLLGPVNYEYPGNAHVLTAPAINGFDLSAWAQVPSGRHRLVFVFRPRNNVNFKDLSATIRGNILIDTTIDLSAGEVYTIEALARDVEKKLFGLYVRKEQFIHQAFDPAKLYVGFVNLSGEKPSFTQIGMGAMLPEKPIITYSTYLPNDVTIPVGTPPIYHTTLQKRMDTDIDYLALPIPPRSDFFVDDTLRSYASDKVVGAAGRLDGYPGGGLPCYVFRYQDIDNPAVKFSTYSSANPRTFNSLKIAGTLAKYYTPNLHLIVNANNDYHIYGTINIMEIVYDRVYLMQIQRGFNEVPQK
ncbi:hypothetical protein KTO58_13990 [Chitinophaga pendula]|uniref:hypothetical protein n=1 Tax=Chitinophaga TaxID=79328 RepID=UPI000BAF6DBC|nr:MULTISPECIES: hypothetical protein [Chitinophaga]ASZ12145.1 hypothetical protein CK934_14845 [Chitinophaga sp. MD30]UCJ04815.1 hypothetical protein KTO58_13990 [Chitinophaga pendula]